jgi:single-stranded-DNA-specific exonuclease
MAAGLTIAGDAIPEFREAFNALAEPGSAERAAASRLFVDAEVRLADLTTPLVNEFARLAPFGAGNPEPVFGVTGVKTLRRRVVGDGRHLRLDVTDGTATREAIGFAMAAPAELLIFTEAPVDLAVVPGEDPHTPGGVRLRVVALDVPGVDPEHMLRDTGALVERLFSRAAEYVDGPRGPGVEDAPAFYSKIAGVTFDGRQDILAALHPGDRLTLVREPANPHDPHAVRVTTHDGRTLGYLRARLAGRLAPSIDAGARYRAVVAAVTGGGDRPMGVNILVERETELAQDTGVGSGRAPALTRLAAPDGLAGRALGERLAAELNGRYQLAPSHGDAVAAIIDGTPAAILLPPGRGVASVLACGAAAVARDGRCALVVTPRRRQVMHRADQIRARLAPLGFRVCAIHGLQDIGERERANAALRAGEADIVVASCEAVASGWAQAHADRIAAALGDGISRADAAVLADMVPAAPVSLVNPHGYAAPAPWPTNGTRDRPTFVREDAVRTGVRMIDRRGAVDRDRLVEEVVSRDEKIVVYAIGREECVRLAARLRDRAGGEARVAYLHSGLPARVRHIVLQAFRESRLEILVATPALDEEALPPDVRHVVIAALPPDRERLADGLGALGFNERPISVTVLFGPDELPSRRLALNAQVPDRPQLASMYRALASWRRDAPVSWPSEETWTYLRAAVPGLTPAAVDAAFTIFEEAGVGTREVVGDHMDVELASGARRDLTTSLRYREGRREREAFEECARWALRASTIQLLGAMVGKRDGDEPARIPVPSAREP